MAVFAVPVIFKFEGEFFIEADSRVQAEEYAEKHCGLVIGGNIHSSLPYEDVDWDFPTHPKKIVRQAKRIQEKQP